jgi:putative FmdB family regulatory protein
LPTYQYECSSCDHGFEVLQSMLDKKLRKCPECSHNTLKRLIGSGSGIIFKGSGFYETDYKRKKLQASDSSSKESPKVGKPDTQTTAKPNSDVKGE